ncbi:hypothetical protein BV898_01440 [Hypsibius exemplaris]|uniref:Uncharacterized protein n=1 Tax=Hypsibius exemplaris TaxID=2072580 RepID=A0A1W0XBZ5_HYPEX|nr:hypothetical protein BV898_01440 [Hypsibius exemplaris]
MINESSLRRAHYSSQILAPDFQRRRNLKNFICDDDSGAGCPDPHTLDFLNFIFPSFFVLHVPLTDRVVNTPCLDEHGEMFI